MEKKKEWIRCSSVAIGFYLIIYLLFAYEWFGFFNPWLIGTVLILALVDVKALHWLISVFGDEDHDPFP